MSDSGEGRWIVIAAVDEGVPEPVLTTFFMLDLSFVNFLSSVPRCYRRCANSSAVTTRSPPNSWLKRAIFDDVGEHVIMIIGRCMLSVG